MRVLKKCFSSNQHLIFSDHAHARERDGSLCYFTLLLGFIATTLWNSFSRHFGSRRAAVRLRRSINALQR